MSNSVWREKKSLYMILAMLAIALYYIFQDGLHHMFRTWEAREEYGDGYIISFVTAFLVWQKSNQLEKQEFIGSWLGMFIVSVGVLQLYAGKLSSIYSLIVDTCASIYRYYFHDCRII